MSAHSLLDVGLALASPAIEAARALSPCSPEVAFAFASGFASGAACGASGIAAPKPMRNALAARRARRQSSPYPTPDRTQLKPIRPGSPHSIYGTIRLPTSPGARQPSRLGGLLRGAVSPGSPLRLVISPGAADFVNGVANGLDSAQPLVSSGGEGAAAPDPAPTPRGPSVEETLSRFVGMEDMKTLVKSVAQQSGINAQLKANGHPVRHKRMAFFIDGNPGTGKTKIAEALHGLLISSGTLLPDAPFISVNAASMEGQHLGEARVNTDAKILQAKGGLLFCDEVTCPTYIVVVGAMV